MSYTVRHLEIALPTLPVSKQDFARSIIRRAAFRPPSDKEMFWVNKLVADNIASTQPKPEPAKIGSLAGIQALFDKAKRHLKFPAIVMSVPATPTTAAFSIRINVAGERATFPGSLNVVSAERNEGTGRRDWYGRVKLDGSYEPAKDVSDKVAKDAPAAITARLIEFAANPTRVAAEHGRLTGRCCFCNTALKDERSTAVGYGKTCATHYGLPWGARE